MLNKALIIFLFVFAVVMAFVWDKYAIQPRLNEQVEACVYYINKTGKSSPLYTAQEWCRGVIRLYGWREE